MRRRLTGETQSAQRKHRGRQLNPVLLETSLAGSYGWVSPGQNRHLQEQYSDDPKGKTIPQRKLSASDHNDAAERNEEWYGNNLLPVLEGREKKTKRDEDETRGQRMLRTPGVTTNIQTIPTQT